jgi:uncharacterized protein (TIGR02569 family)
MTMDEAPGDDVVEAFGGHGPAEQLHGGQGGTYVAGGVVIKPAGDEDEATWIAEVLSAIEEDGFRVARPIRASGGSWVVDGWAGFRWVEGEHRLWGGPWAEAIASCERFHAALADVSEPAFLGRRCNRFAQADRIAWGDIKVDLPRPVAEMTARLRELARPVKAGGQVVHGDLAGNLLFVDGLPPAVIDFSPYWRPAGYATAMIIVDAVLWYGEGVGLASHAGHVAELDQLLLRGLLFRLTLDGLLMQSSARLVRWEPSQIDWDLDHAAPLVACLEGRIQR